jgi:hypothetical protein
MARDNSLLDSNPSRPHRDLAGQTTVNAPESIVTSVDSVLDWAGLPEAGPILHRVAPRNIAEVIGVPTPDELSDELLMWLDDQFDIRFPPER